MNLIEFGTLVDEIKQNLKEIEKGSQVFNGMMHKNTVISLLKHITRKLEAHLETDTKQYVELEAKAAELDRREKGVEVDLMWESPCGTTYGYCYKCKSPTREGNKYCSCCGYRLIWKNY